MVAYWSDGDPLKYNAFMQMTRSEFYAIIYGYMMRHEKG